MEMSDRLSAFVAVLMTAFACTVTAAAPTRCSGTDIFVAGADDTDVAEACRAAAEARGVLQAIGLELPRGVAIRLVERAGDDGLGVGERARYETGSHAIVLRGYATTARAMPPGLAEDSAAAGRAVWRSYVVHELAHAAIHLSCVSTCPRRAVQGDQLAAGFFQRLSEFSHRLADEFNTTVSARRQSIQDFSVIDKDTKNAPTVF